MHAPIPARPLHAPIPLPEPFPYFWKQLQSTRKWSSLRLTVLSVRIVGPLHVDMLRACLDELIKRHETLRTRVCVTDTTPLLQVLEPQKAEVEVIDLSDQRGEQDVSNNVRQFACSPFDRLADALWVARLFKLQPDEHIFACAFDHLISDAGSVAILDEELWALYRQGVMGQPFCLPPLSIQFGDYLVWRRDNYDATVRNHLPYWKQYLDGVTPSKYPRVEGLDASAPFRPKIDSGAAAIVTEFRLDRALSDELRKLAKQCRALLPLAVFGLHCIVLAKWLATREVAIHFVSNGRYRDETQRIFGYLGQPLMLRMDIDDEKSFVELIRRSTGNFYQALKHESSWDTVLHVLGVPSMEFTECYFNWAPFWAAERSFEDPGERKEVRVSPYLCKPPTTSGFLPIYSDSTEGIRLTIHHRPSIFPGVAENFAGALELMANVLCRSPHEPISNLPLPRFNSSLGPE